MDRHEFTVKIVDRSHAVTRDLPAELQANDELYHHMHMQPGVHVLATSFDDRRFNGTGNDEPVIWTVDSAKAASSTPLSDMT